MAYIDDLTTPATGDAAMRRVLVRALAAGWSVPRSSDGITYNALGNQITADSGPNSTANPGAWFLLRMAGTTREYLYQRGAASTAWRSLYSVAGFTGGGITTAPTAADEVSLWGGGVGSYSTVLPADGGYRWLLCFEDAAPYYFGMDTFPIGGGSPFTVFHGFPLRSGSYPSTGINLEQDPYVILADAHADAGKYNRIEYSVYAPGNGVPGAWRRYGLSSPVFAAAPIPQLVQQGGGTAASLPTGNVNTGEQLPKEIPVMFFGQGDKGYHRDLRLANTDLGVVPSGTHLTGGDGRYWIRVNNLWVPWGATPPTL